MSLSSSRTLAYLFGALTGAFAALWVVTLADRDGRATRWAVLSLVCGALSVAFEERATAREA